MRERSKQADTSIEADGATGASMESMIRRIGGTSWSLVGFLFLAAASLVALSAVSEIVLPLVFAAMLGAVARPGVRRLERHRFPSSVAAATVVTGVVASMALIVVLLVRAVVRQTSELALNVDQALANLGDRLEPIGLDADAIDRLRHALASSAAFIGRGLLTGIVDGVGSVAGFLGGSILGLLILYYVLKDAPVIKDWLLRHVPERHREDASDFLDASLTRVRRYWLGRSILSAAVTAVVALVSLAVGVPMIGTLAVVNFVGGFVPYLGAFVGGGLATLLALGHGGVDEAVLILCVVLVANLVLENMLEPRIMSNALRIHPLIVLIATTTGGAVGGLVGLILAVPVFVLGLDLVREFSRIRATSDRIDS